MIYKYSLEKYSGPGSRYKCPQCGRREFVKYIDTLSGEYLSDLVGKCNRIEKCGYHYSPRDFGVENRKILPARMSKVNKDKDKDKDLFVFPRAKVLNSLHSQSNQSDLFHFISGFFGEPSTLQVFRKYGVGVSKNYNKAVVFWQLDSNGKCRAGKVMKYSRDTGRRNPKIITWVKKGMRPDEFSQQCFFGAHLLKKYPDHTVAIVESEKTALICELYFKSDYIWLASGGLQGLQDYKFEDLIGRKVVLFPDLSTVDSKINAFQMWSDSARHLRGKFGIDVSVSDYLELIASEMSRAEQWDLADFIVRHRRSKAVSKRTAERSYERIRNFGLVAALQSKVAMTPCGASNRHRKEI